MNSVKSLIVNGQDLGILNGQDEALQGAIGEFDECDEDTPMTDELATLLKKLWGHNLIQDVYEQRCVFLAVVRRCLALV